MLPELLPHYVKVIPGHELLFAWTMCVPILPC
jgi:hypothetical protein